MSRVNTKDQILQAALELFVADGYQKTSIARIETEAGLAPRAGAFYRHFESKQVLLEEIARLYISETPEEFGLDRLADFGDTRAELVAIGLKYEAAMTRQKPYARLIEEIRLLDFGADLRSELNTEMMVGLAAWVGGKPAAKGKSRKQISALVIRVFGSWLFYLSMAAQGLPVDSLRDTLLEEWATDWASVLDAER